MALRLAPFLQLTAKRSRHFSIFLSSTPSLLLANSFSALFSLARASLTSSSFSISIFLAALCFFLAAFNTSTSTSSGISLSLFPRARLSCLAFFSLRICSDFRVVIKSLLSPGSSSSSSDSVSVRSMLGVFPIDLECNGKSSDFLLFFASLTTFAAGF